MAEIITLLGIGIALSMDTFSLSLSIGMFLSNNSNNVKISTIVGILHFILPLIGIIIGKIILKIIPFPPHLLMSVILFIIAIIMLKDLKKDNNHITLSSVGIFLFALSVSIDSFITGIGLKSITTHYFLSALIFSICSFSFTYLGLIMGKYAQKKLGEWAKIFGIVLLILIAIFNIIG